MGKKILGGRWEIALPDPLPPPPRRIITISPAGEAAEVARDVGNKIYEDLPKDKILRRPLSPTGKQPITHYICSMKQTLEKSLDHLDYECKMGTMIFDLDADDAEYVTPLAVMKGLGLKFVDPRQS